MNYKLIHIKQTVLVVDDSKDIIDAYGLIFETKDRYKVSFAFDYPSSILALNDCFYHSIILDYNLEKPQTGLDIIKYIRNDLKLPAIVYANSGSPSKNDELIEAGADYVIAKNFQLLMKYFK